MFGKRLTMILAVMVLSFSLASGALADGLRPSFSFGVDPFVGSPFFTFGLEPDPFFVEEEIIIEEDPFFQDEVFLF